ncbi:hypothetical protein K8B33_13945 [Alcanivorax sp. JB21]|uniref:hypothetical protein n=1 Tax=Alcanivorax limicola TaxID=2874102 RepID=UPI001CBFC678|nr:hypothetical protein [Alcanivorax limicola]MBZ2190207.1 hypothetical protein [Alcanivorax limicola]
MTRLLTVPALLAALLTLSACGTEPEPMPVSEKNADRAPEALTYTTGDNVYINDMFSLRIEKPEGWFAQSAEDMILMQQQGSALFSDDDNIRQILKASLESTLPLFGFFEVPPGTPGRLNPNILGTAENIRLAPGITSGCDYLAHARQALQQMQIRYEVDEQCGQREINGTDFGYFEAQAMFGSQLVRQRYLALVRDKHAIVVVQSFFDEDSEALVNAVLDTLTMQGSL